MGLLVDIKLIPKISLGDTIILRNGEQYTVKNVKLDHDLPLTMPIEIITFEGFSGWYTPNGYYDEDAEQEDNDPDDYEHDYDILEVIKR